MSGLNVSFASIGGKTAVEHCKCGYPFKITAPFYGGKRASVIVMAASPGMLNDDEYEIDITAKKNAAVQITDQAYTKILNTQGGVASQSLKLKAEENAELLWLPKPIIPYRGSSAVFNADVQLKKSSMFVFCEIIACGRVGMGERFKFTSFSSRMLVSIEGKPVFGDNLRLSGSENALDDIGFFEGHTHMGTVYLYGCRKPVLPSGDGVTAFMSECVEGTVVRMSGFSGDSLYKFANEIAQNAQREG